MEQGSTEKCSTLRKWVDQRAMTYLGVKTLLEAADYLYDQAVMLEDRVRLGEQLTAQEIETFVEEQAKNLIRTCVGEIWVRESLKVLIEERGHELVMKCFKAYERTYEEEQQKEQAN
jgi:hypothetical protein